MRKQDHEIWEVILREAYTLRAREHPHIVPLLASYTEHTIESEYEVKFLNLLFPYSEMNLHEWLYLDEAPQFLPQASNSKQLKTYVYNSISSLCSALAYLHREIKGLISSHHDLKPKNILLFGEIWKIADFGRSHLIPLDAGSETEAKSGLGTFAYNPPEYWDDTGHRANVRHGRAFDIWAMGCIIIELATIAVYGWSSKGLRRFRKNRTMNQARSRIFNDRDPTDDGSFHNNMNVVGYWIDELRNIDGSSYLVQTLGVANSMLSQDQSKRPLSWEVDLDFYELFNPNESNAEKVARTTNGIQTPSRRSPIGTENPLQRAVMHDNLLRVRCLLDAGWPAGIVDVTGLTTNFQARERVPAAMMDVLIASNQQRQVEAVVHKLPWRRTLRKVRESKEAVSSVSDMRASRGKQNSLKEKDTASGILAKEA